jgi:predicted nucleic acid-binding protein
MVLVDTNVLFALLLENDWSQSARDLYERDADWRTETHALVELSNVLTRYVRLRKLAVAQATTILNNAQGLIGSGLCEVRHSDALALAVDRGVSAYAARFLCAAKLLGAHVVTEDVKLRKAAPDLTCSLADALAA